MEHPILALPFLVLLVAFLLFHLKGKSRYGAFTQAMDKKEYGLRDFMTVGFAIMELSKHSFGSKLDRKMRRQLSELYEQEYVEFYLRVHWAAAVTYGYLGLLLGTLFFAVMGDPTFLVLFAVVAVCLGYSVFSDLEKKIGQRHLAVTLDLPDLTNQVLILSGAGLTLRAALIKIGQEMPGETPLYQSLRRAVNKMENGATDEEAMDTMVTACNMPEIRRLVSVWLQNMQRGGTDVLLALKEIGAEMWTNRKAAARRVAEEAGTKLLFPMMLMLLAVILLVAAPAVMSMNI